MVTANDSAADKKRAFQQGADEFLGKPLTLDLINRTLDNIKGIGSSCLKLSPDCRFIFSLFLSRCDTSRPDLPDLMRYVRDFRAGSILYSISRLYKYINYFKSTFMGNLLYIIAVILVIAWAIGFFGYHAGGIIHILLVIAIVAVLLKVIGDPLINKCKCKH